MWFIKVQWIVFFWIHRKSNNQWQQLSCPSELSSQVSIHPRCGVVGRMWCFICLQPVNLLCYHCFMGKKKKHGLTSCILLYCTHHVNYLQLQVKHNSPEFHGVLRNFLFYVESLSPWVMFYLPLPYYWIFSPSFLYLFPSAHACSKLQHEMLFSFSHVFLRGSWRHMRRIHVCMLTPDRERSGNPPKFNSLQQL